MFYGGTNWGTLGDPDVYTSYDYCNVIINPSCMYQRVRSFEWSRPPAAFINVLRQKLQFRDFKNNL